MKITFRCPPELDGVLPRPVAAKRGLPGWLKAMPMTAGDEDLGFAVRTVKQCPPFIDAMGCGVLMPLAADVTVADGAFSWSWRPGATAGRHTRSPLGMHTASQAAGSPLFDPDALFVKFMNFWTITLPDGWSLLCTHPVNRTDLPFRTLTGLVDADAYGDGLIHFPAVWADRGFEGVLPAGTPVAQCIPVPRQPLELDCAPLTDDEARRFAATVETVAAEPGVYRRRFRAPK
jgi:hypothetical protein